MNIYNLAKDRIAIIGLGLIGGSIALALRGKCQKLYGVDQDPDVVSFAETYDIVDQATTKPEEVLALSNVIILATPIGAIQQIVGEIPAYHPGEAIILDVGSTKKEILEAYNKLPVRFDPIGGHPMCGKEMLSIANADRMLFQDAPFAFTPLERTTQKAIDFATRFAETIGAHPLLIDGATHDTWTAASSHLPHLISLSLVLSTPPEVKPLIGTGFKSTVRLAGTPGSMVVDILRTNQDEILKACSRFSEQLKEITKMLDASDFDSLLGLMERGRYKRDTLVGRGKR
jgi:prephenate dehydrogenase